MGNTDYRIKARQIDSPDQIRLTASTLFPQSHNSANFLPHFAIFSISNLAIFTKVGIIDYIVREESLIYLILIPHNANYGVFFMSYGAGQDHPHPRHLPPGLFFRAHGINPGGADI